MQASRQATTLMLSDGSVLWYGVYVYLPAYGVGIEHAPNT